MDRDNQRRRLLENGLSPRLCIRKTLSSGFPSNVTLLLPGRLRNPASSSLPHVADFNSIRHRWDLRDPQTHRPLRFIWKNTFDPWAAPNFREAHSQALPFVSSQSARDGNGLRDHGAGLG